MEKQIKSILDYIKIIFFKLVESVYSTLWWSVLWIIGFYISMVAIWLLLKRETSLQEVVSISTIVLTITVVAGHFPKLISYLLGCDTDFKGIKGGVKIKMSFILKFFLGFVFLSLSVANLWYANTGILSIGTPFSWFSEKHLILSWKFVLSILFLFLAQMTFSWPDSIKQRNDITIKK